MTGLRLRQNLKLKDTDLESLSYQGFGVAMQLLKHREDAMDVVQESLRKLVHSGKYNGKLGTRRSWFLKVVRNGSLDVLRRRKPHDPEALTNQADNNKTPDVATERNELTELLKRELNSMPQNQQEIILLRDHQDLSYAEIAEVLTIPAGTVMSRLHRARNELRNRMKKYLQ
ncbi:sigma-70 family RNA polymerase sigma factor [bacterium]|nr:sigma-70 family RNA polymerase sigma factor [bacterium]